MLFFKVSKVVQWASFDRLPISDFQYLLLSVFKRL